MEVIFRVGMAVLETSQIDLLQLDMEGMLRYFQKEVPAKYEHDPDSLLNCSYQVKYSAKKMKKLEKEYNALKTKEHEEQVELRRLRTENRLLRQRIENLEKETEVLADRLIHDQVERAQKEEEMFILRREMSGLRHQGDNAQQQLDKANEEIKELKRSHSNGGSSNLTIDNETQMEMIEQMQQELVAVRLKEAESGCQIKELKDKIKDLQEINQKLEKDPSAEIQGLQEELIACKLREAEANLSMKELRQRVNELDNYWQKHLERIGSGALSGKEKAGKHTVRELQDELMMVRLREAESLADLKEMKQKVMELETQTQIQAHQVRRLDDENENLKGKMEENRIREQGLKNLIKELERNIADLDGKRKTDSMMLRIKDAEHSQVVAEMRHRIAELEIENQELVTAGQLQDKDDRQDMKNKICDLEEEVLQLKMTKKLQSLSSLALNHLVDSDSEEYESDIDATLCDNTRLNRYARGSVSSAGSGLEDCTEIAEGMKVTRNPLTDSTISTESWGGDSDGATPTENMNGGIKKNVKKGLSVSFTSEELEDTLGLKAPTRSVTSAPVTPQVEHSTSIGDEVDRRLEELENGGYEEDDEGEDQEVEMKVSTV